jgi:carbamoyl-phosphate synthase large subunit
MGVELHGTKGTVDFLRQSGIEIRPLAWPLDGVSPHAVDFIRDGKVDLVINIPKDDRPDELTNGYMIRRAAVDYNVPLITNRQIAMRFIEAASRLTKDQIHAKPWAEYASI